jgi:hypothetical protein
MTPFDMIHAKQRVGHEYADEAELFVLLHFDAAKRGQLAPIGYNFISRHLVMAQYIFARLKANDMLKVVQLAGLAWQNVGGRPGKLVYLEDAEYAPLCAGLRAYFRALPRIEAGTYRQACNVADQVMQ